MTPVNDPPETANTAGSGPEDTPIILTLTGSDIDGTVQSFTITELPLHGQLKIGSTVLVVGSVVTATGNTATVTFVPDANWNGSTTFKYASKDNVGLSDATPATGTITITPVNDLPDAINDSGATLEDTPINFTVAQLLANDTDPDGNTLTVTSVQSAVNGTVTLINGVAKFTPTANYNGPASFTYSISDGNGGVDTATVNITVTPVNDPPDAINDSGVTQRNQAITFTKALLLSNDTDPENDPLNILSVQSAVNGTVSYVNGVATFTPTNGFVGAASFTYTISDGNGGTDTATVNIQVLPPAPGVGTPGFWGNNGAVYWDGQVDPAGTKHSPTHANFPAAELTYVVDANADGTKDNNQSLLIGDFNKNGLTDAGEHTIAIGLKDALSLVKGGATSDPLVKVGRDLVTTWLNYLAGNPEGTVAQVNSPAWFVQEAVDWLAELVGTTKTLSGGIATYNVMSNGNFLNPDPNSAITAAWQSGINLDGVAGIVATGKDVLAGEILHTTLDYFNNTGMIGSTIWAQDRDAIG